MDIPKELSFMLLQRGGRERIVKELEARSRTKEKALVVFSTQELPKGRDDSLRNKGCHPVSNDVVMSCPFDNMTSGRTKFWSLRGSNGRDTIISYQTPKVRVRGEGR